ncbi:conserved unknown protein [Ectocarpus siliculosus]|uniref:Aminoglycoside phosphotransferase domain-containing protein n=1 Tax=Ectocarpus siliculosus TaxID=2880 RepID=D8LKT3_ECTSI|nr:conserved unknown protein [Ectocarpus siliculosus]|eukprot:CBN80066.1 conserved unknown protein [Ectocarpus siliculosus]
MGHEGFDGFRIELKKFSSGQSNPTFLLEVHLSPPPAAATSTTTTTTTSSRANNQRRFVLRKKPASVTVSSAHAVEREFRILRALRLDPASDVPVPRPLLLCEDPAVIGTPFYVMEFVQGRIFSDAALPGLAPAERAAAYESAAETLARLHHVDFVRAGLGGFGRGEGGYLGRQVATLERVAAKQAEDAGPIEGFDGIVRDLRELIASGSVVQDRVAIVHGDFRIDNLVFHPTESRVIAVLDWELSTLGHPLADLANLCILHHLPASAVAIASAAAAPAVGASRRAGAGAAARAGSTENRRPSTLSPPPSTTSPLAGLKGLDLKALGIPQQSELMAAYRRAASTLADGGSGGGGDPTRGVAGPGVAELGLAFVFFKMAVIAHGVKARQFRGVASSAQASLVSAMVPAMVALAKEQVSNLRRVLAAGGGNGGGEDSGSGGGGGRKRGSPPPLARPRAVFFDVGGVLSESPLLAILRFEKEALLPPSYVGVAIAAAGQDGLFQRLERGEERLGDRFLERFEEYLVGDEAKRAYVGWCVARRRWRRPTIGKDKTPSSSTSPAGGKGGQSCASSAPRASTNVATPRERGGGGGEGGEGGGDAGQGAKEEAEAAVASVVAVDVRELFQRITAAARVPVPEMIDAAQSLRRQGFLVGAVSNDFLVERGFALGRPRRRDDKPGVRAAEAAVAAAVKAEAGGGNDGGSGSGGGGGVYSRLPDLCDVVVLSSATGSRKPSRKIYDDACRALGVSAPEAVFVDDIRENIVAAEALGMRTVWMASGGSIAAALSELEAVTGVKLAAGGGVRRPPGKL